MLNHTLAILSEDNRLVMGELRSRGGEEWAIISKSHTQLAKEERKVLDLALLPGGKGTRCRRGETNKY